LLTRLNLNVNSVKAVRLQMSFSRSLTQIDCTLLQTKERTADVFLLLRSTAQLLSFLARRFDLDQNCGFAAASLKIGSSAAMRPNPSRSVRHAFPFERALFYQQDMGSVAAK